MKRVFISQPMRGKTGDEILRERDAILAMLPGILGEPVELIDSYLGDEAADSKKPLWYLSKSLEIMSDADLVVFAPGWEEARGCAIEHKCASEYGYDMLEV